MSPTRTTPGTQTSRSASSCTPRGPTRSPHALSRGNAALSTRATCAPARARTRAATLPAGPAPTTTTSKRSSAKATSGPLGVSYGRRLGGTMADPNRVAQDLFDGLPDRYDRLEEVLSLGQNRRWRRLMCDQAVGSHATSVLDVASGTAGVAIQVASRGPARVVGIDLTEAMLRRGQANVATAGLDGRISLTAGRAERLPFGDATFDGLTFTYLLRYVADPQATLDELVRVVTPGATVASLEFLVPPNP